MDTWNSVGALDPSELDEIYRSLSDAMRRQLLVYLDSREGSVTFDELVEYFSATDDDRDALARAGSLYSNDIAARLHHVHLPKLEEAGFVEVSEEPTGRMVYSTHLLEQVATWPLFSRSGYRW